jgi:hypothetical protein
MNKVSAGVTLTATWPHAVREPIHQYRRSDQRAGASGSLPGKKACLVSPRGAGFTALARPQNSDCGSPVVRSEPALGCLVPRRVVRERAAV